MNSTFNIRSYNDFASDSDYSYLNSNKNNDKPNNKNKENKTKENLTELIFNEIEEKKEETKKLKISNFKNTNINLEKINFCIQNVHWHEINKNREDLIRHYEMHQEGNRNNYEINAAEIEEKKTFALNKQTDIFFNFSEYHLNVEPIYNHFQLRKNLVSISDKELVFFNEKGVEMLNLINSKKTQLVYLKQDEHDKAICFDAFKPQKFGNSFDNLNQNKKEFEVNFVFGKFNNRITVMKTKVFEKLKRLVSEVIYKEDFIVSDLPDQNQLVNYVKFSEDGKLIYTSCNDGFIKIFDFENAMNLVTSYKSKNCVNHFSYNQSRNIIAAVGDYEEVHLIDPKSHKTIAYMQGHYDFGFVTRFKPQSDFILATGNQDYSAKIWDLRKIADDMDNKKDYLKNYFYNNKNLKKFKLKCGNYFSRGLKGNKNKKCFWNFNSNEYNDYLSEIEKENVNDKSIIDDESDIKGYNYNEMINENADLQKISNKACLKTYFGVSNSIGDLRFTEDDFLLMLENTYNLHVVNLLDDKMQSIKYIGYGIGIDYNEQMQKLYLGLYQHNYSGIYAYKKISNFLEAMELRNTENCYYDINNNI